MKIAIGSDHRGYQAKERVKALLMTMGLDVVDLGTHSNQACDYPDAGFAVAEQVGSQEVERGVLFCGSGIGMSITANKVRGVRAALCHDELTAQMSRRHNDANILCLPADLIGDALMQGIVRIWLSTQFEGGRHARRVEKILEFEATHQRDAVLDSAVRSDGHVAVPTTDVPGPHALPPRGAASAGMAPPPAS